MTTKCTLSPRRRSSVARLFRPRRFILAASIATLVASLSWGRVVGSAIKVSNSKRIADRTGAAAGSGGSAAAASDAGAAGRVLRFTGGTDVLTSNAGTFTGGLLISSSRLNLDPMAAAGATGRATYSSIGSGGGSHIVTAHSNNSVTRGGAKTHSGGTTALGGATLQISKSLAVGSGNVSLPPGSTLPLANVAFANTVNITGDPTINVTGASSMPGITGSGTINILGTSGSAATDVLTLTTGGGSTYSGPTFVGDGATAHAVTLTGGALNAFSPNSDITVTASSILDLGGYSQTIASLAGAGTVTNSGGAAATLTVGGDNASTTFSGVIQNGASATGLTKTGTGTLILTGTNTYSGGTTVTGGTLQVGNSSALGSGSVSLQAASTLAFTGGVAMANAVSVTGNPNIAVTGANSMSAISGTGTVSVLGTSGSAATDVLTLTTGGGSTYSGPTFVGDGTTAHAVTLKGGAYNGFSANSDMTITANSILDLGGVNGEDSQTIASLAGAGNVTNSGGVLVTLTAGGDNASTIFSGEINDGVHGIGLTKTGTGTLTLTGASAFDGNAEAAGGTIQVSGGGSLTGSSTIIADTGGTFTVDGTLSSGVTTHSYVTALGLTVGNVGNGTLNVQNAAVVTVNGDSYLGDGAHTSVGTVVVTGLGSQLNGENLTVGQTGPGVLNIQNGGVVTLSVIGTLGGQNFGKGTVTVTDPGSQWNLPALTIGLFGMGTLNIQNGGVVKVGGGTGGVTFGEEPQGTGTLNIGAFGGGTTAGTLQASSVNEGSGGTGVVNFNQTDTATFAPQINGRIDVNQLGTGTTVLTGANTYTSGTQINGGTLSIGADNALGNSSGGMTFGGGALETTATFSTARGITLNSGGGAFSPDASTTFTVTSAIGGAGGLIEQGGGTLVLSGVNTYSGGTQLNAGTLAISADTALGAATGGVTFNGGALQANASLSSARAMNLPSGQAGYLNTNGNTVALSGAITGPGNLIVEGAGTLTLSGTADNTSLGVTVNSGTTVILAKASSSGVHAIGTSGLDIEGGTVQLGGSGGDQIYNTAPVTVNSGTFDLLGQSETIGALSGTGGVVTNTGGSVSTLTVTGASNTTFSGTLSYGANLLTVVQQGSGTLTLGGTTDNAGLAVTVNSGTVILAKSSSAGIHAIGGGGLDIEGGTVQLGGTGGDQIYDNAPVTVNSGTLDLNGQNETIGALIGTNGSVVNNAGGVSTLTVTSAGNTTFSGILGNPNGGVTLVQKGTGMLVLSGAGNNYALSLIADAGTVILGKTSAPLICAIGNFLDIEGGTVQLAGSGGNQIYDFVPVTVNSGTFDLNGQSETIGALSGSGGTITNTASGVPSTLTVGGSGSGAGTFGGTITNGAGGLALVKAGAGTLLLTGTNTYTGGTQINAGTLAINADAALGNASGGVTFNGGTLETTATGSTARGITLNSGGGTFSPNANTTFTVTSAIGGAGGLTDSGPGLLILTGTNTYSGGTTVTAGTLQISNASALSSGSVSLQAGSTLALPGGVALANAVSVTGDPDIEVTGANSMSAISGTGTINILGTSGSAATDVLTLTTGGGSTYSGPTFVGDGTAGHAVTLKGGATNAFSANSDVTVTANSILDLGGFSQTIGSLAGAGTVIDSGGTYLTTLTTGGDNASTTFSGAINTVPLIKNGTGTLTFTGTFNASGNRGLQVLGGTFQVSGGGSVTTSGQIIMDTGGTLTVDGTTPSSVTTSANMIVGNNGTGTLNVQNGGTVTATTGISCYIAFGPSSVGTVTVTGLGSQLTAPFLLVGNAGTGTLTIENGGLETTVQRVTIGVTYSGNVTGMGTVVVTDPGSLLKTDELYVGNLGTGALTIENGGQVTCSSTSASVILGYSYMSIGTVTVMGTGAGSPSQSQWTTNVLTVGENGAGTLNVENGGVVQVGNSSGTVNLAEYAESTGTLNIGAYGVATNNPAGTFQAGTVKGGLGTAVVNFNQSDTTTFASNITGTVAVNQLGAGTTTLTGTNTYTGGTQINAGTLVISSDAALGNTSGALTFNGGTLETTATGSTARGITLNSGGGAFSPNVNTTFTVTSAIGGAGSLTDSGAGLLILTGTNTYTGATTVSAGTLQAGSTQAFGVGSAVNLTASGATLDLNGNSNTIASLSGVAGTFVNNSSSTAATLTVGDSTPSTTFAGVIENTVPGRLSLIKQGTGTLVLTGQNLPGGGTTIRDGTLQIPGGGSLSGGNIVVGNNSGDIGTLNLTGGSVSGLAYLGYNSGSSGTATVSSGAWTNAGTFYVGDSGVGILNVTGGSVSGTSGVLGNSSGSSGTATISSGSWTCTTGALYVGNSGTAVLNVTGGSVSNVLGILGANVGSSGTVTVSSGSWTNTDLNVGISGTGVLNVTGTGVVNVGPTLNHTLHLAQNTGSNGTLNLGNGGLAGTLDTGSVSGGSGTAVVNFNQAASYTFALPLTGSLSVNNIGTGTTILTAASTYTGGTTVTAGTLLVSGSISGSTTTVTGSGSTLGGTGTVGPVSVGSGAILEGGNGSSASGALSSGGNVSLTSGAIIELTLGPGGTTSSLARTGGAWSFDLNQQFVFNIIPGASVTTYDDLITGLAGTEAGLANISNWTIDTPGVAGVFSFDGASGNVDLTLSAVPEPGTAALLLAGLPLLVRRRRRP